MTKSSNIEHFNKHGEEHYSELKRLLETDDNPEQWLYRTDLIKFLGMMKLYNDNFKGSGSHASRLRSSALTSGMRKMTSFMNRDGGTKQKRPKNKRSKKTRRRK